MARIIVLGAGLNGLTTALLLAREGHDITVLERDPAPPPTGANLADAAWDGWDRRGVAQFRLLQFMLPRWRMVMESELPEVVAELVAAGGLRVNVLHHAPDARTGGWRPGDERFDTVTGRRPVVEAALATVASRTTGITVRRGIAVRGLLTAGASSVPTVIGVRTDEGDLTADLVVDAGGRRSAVDRWIVAAGGRSPAVEEPVPGFAYYSRHYRTTGSMPVARDSMLMHHNSLSLLTLPADNNTYALGVVASSHDRDLRALRQRPCWEAVVRQYPAMEPWLDAEPITDITVMAGTQDRRRSFVVDGEPVVLGLVAVGDAWAFTSPFVGRGTSIGALHARTLRDAVAKEGLDDPDALVRRFHAETEATVTPYVTSTASFCRHRLAEMEADIAGSPYQPDDQAWTMSNALFAGAPHDPVLARAYGDIVAMLATPADLFGDPELVQRVLAHVGRSPRRPGPTRGDLLDIVHRSGGRDLIRPSRGRPAGR